MPQADDSQAPGNGLGALEDKRAQATQRRRRQPPPSRHPRPSPGEPTEPPREPTEPAQTPPEDDTPAGPPAEAAAAVSEQQRRESRDERSGNESATGPPPSGGGVSRRGLTQIYLDGELEDWLWEIKAAAAAAKVDVPVSAVAREAFHDYRQRTTPEQIVRTISQREPRSGGRGRPRR